MASTLELAFRKVAGGMARVDAILDRTSGPRDLLALLGWDTPPGQLDVGLAALDLSALVDAVRSLDVAISIGTTGLVLDAKYAQVAQTVTSFVKGLDGVVNGFSAAPNYLAKTDIKAQFVPRLLDYFVVEALNSNALAATGSLAFLGVVQLVPFGEDPSIFQVAHIRRVVRWDRIPRVFSDIRGLLAEVYAWGQPGFDPTTLVIAIGAILQGLTATAKVRALPRRAESALTGSDVAQADVSPMTQVLLSITRGLGFDPVDAGISIMGLRPSSPGGADAGLSIAPHLHGTTDLQFPLSSQLNFFLDATLDVTKGVAMVVRPGSGAVLKNNLTAGGIANVANGHLLAGLRYTAEPGKSLPMLTIADGTGVTASSVSMSGGVDVSGGQLAPLAQAELSGGHLTLDTSQMDSFLANIIPLSVDVPFDFAVGWSSSYGFFFKGSASPSVTIGLHASIGPFAIETLHLELDTAQGDTLPLELSLSGKGSLGPFKVTVDRIGMNVAVALHRGNLGPADLSLSFKPPNGLGMELDAGLISGGGYLYIDSQKHRYAGILECSIADIVQVKIIGVLDTVLPDGTPEFSLLLVITTNFPPVQLSFGFTLNGVGGVGGVNRTMATDALRAGFRAHHLNSVLFPNDPIDNAPQIISDLSSFFPPADGRYMFGPMFALAWGTPSLITLSVGVILEIPDPIKIVILGEIKMALPTDDLALIELNIDVLGIIDFGAKLLTIQGAMYDSRVTIFSVSGDMALMLAWGDNANFAFSVGGLHPRFQPPPNFPQLNRCCVSIGDGDNPRLSSSTYFAVTSNSAQFGASVDLYAAAGGFSIHGWVGFDALFIFTPFSFAIDFSAGLDIEFDGVSLCSIHVDGLLSGPHQWHVHGDAGFHILFIDVSASVDLSWGDTDAVTLPPIKVLPDLEKAFEDPQSWSAKLPGDAPMAFTLAPRPPGDKTLVVHPMGMLEVREKIVPLGQTITKYGNAKPADGTFFTISSVTLNGQPEAQQWLTDLFAIGQYADLTDDQKLTAPSYQPLKSGIAIGSSDVVTSRDVQCVVAYQDGYIDGDDTGMRLRRTYVLPLDIHLAYCRAGAGFVSATRTKGVSQFTPPGTTSAVTTGDMNYVIASTEDLSVRSDILGAPVTHFEAQSVLRAHLTANPSARGSVQVVAVYEAAA
ncbi:DUF6603 domain-containing protein [Paraburkholderia strydomiana]|uniref:DUF6603 domain-containing protein n=1 Tax=Paraburkholderia strydomiana TaxID=1245417 RepID=A0ABW9BWS3_9BURK